MNIKSDLAIKLTKELADDARTEDVSVSILDDDGVITMSGTAPSEQAKQSAIDLVKQHEGVNSVIADIQVTDEEDESRLPGVTAAPFAPRQGGSG